MRLCAYSFKSTRLNMPVLYGTATIFSDKCSRLLFSNSLHFNDQHLTLVPKSPPLVSKLSVFSLKLYLMNNELCRNISILVKSEH